MTPVLRLVLCLSVAACATWQTVPESDYVGNVPAAERAKLDAAHDATLVRAHADIQAAQVALADAQKLMQADARPAAPAKPNAGAWYADRTRERTQMMAEVVAARQAWLRTNLEWRQHRLDAAIARIEVIRNEREIDRARAIDHHLLGNDTYDAAIYRGQLAQVQERWYKAEVAANDARASLEHLGAKMASTKEAYAQLMRNVAPAPSDPSRFQLSGWTTADVPRRGLHSVANNSAPSPRRPRYLRMP
jgi:hypothetical protein